MSTVNLPKLNLPKLNLPLLTLALGLGTFIQVLDGSIANVCIPHIASGLGASPHEGTWIITSFSVSNAIALPLTGWLATRFGQVRLFSLSTLLFAFFSWCCAIAPNFSSMVVFRICQGAVAGSLIPLSQGLLVLHYPDQKKGMALSIWGMIVIIAPILGPIIGGWITENYGWPGIFYINVPLGGLSAALTWWMLQDKETVRQKLPVDVIGFALLAVGIACLQVSFDKGYDLDWFHSPFICTLVASATISLTYFILWERGCAYPIVDLSFFKNRNYSLGVFVSTVSFTLIFGSMVLLPLFLESNLGYTPYLAGLAIAPIGILTFFFAPFVGYLLLKVDLRGMISLSFCLLGAAFYWFSHFFTTHISLEQVMFSRLIQGAGTAFFFIPTFTLAVAELPKEKLASASGIYNGIRLLFGGGIGTSAFITLWNNRQTMYKSLYNEKISLASPSYQQIGEILAKMGLKGAQIQAQVQKLVSDQAAMLSLNDIFYLSAILFFAIIPLVWLMNPTSQVKRQESKLKP